MIWAFCYAALLAVLFIRVQTEPGPPAPQRPLPNEPLDLVMLHHRLFYALLLLSPLEALVLGGRPDARLIGVLLFAAGVFFYRVGGVQLGANLSPFVQPKADGTIVAHGLYAWIRHPMYLGQMLLAIGAPMTLGVRWVAWLAVPAIAVLLYRIAREEAALQARFDGYAAYAAATNRLVPFVF